MKSKQQTRLEEVSTELEALQSEMETDESKCTPENEAKFKALAEEGEKLIKSIKLIESAVRIKSFQSEPASQPKAVVIEGDPNGDGANAEPFTGSKSLGTTFVENDAYKAAVKGGVIKQDTRVRFELKGIRKPSELKATFDTAGTGLTGGVNYQPGIIMVEQQRLTVADLFAQGETTTNVINYIREVSFTNAAGMVAEGAEKPEATFVTAPASAPVRKIAVIAKVTDEMFADFPMMRDYINQRLVFMVEQREEFQLLSANGTGSQIQGVLSVPGIQTEAKGGNNVPDAILNAMTKIRVNGYFEPDAVVIHPNDWRDLQELKDANGQYYFSGPFSNGSYGTGVRSDGTIWNLKVVSTTAIVEGTALVGAFKLGGQVFRRQGITVDSTNSNDDDFAFNLMSLRVEERLALAIYRPLAFCTVTGI